MVMLVLMGATLQKNVVRVQSYFQRASKFKWFGLRSNLPQYGFAPLTGGDPVKDLLQWIDQGETFRQSRDEYQWQALTGGYHLKKLLKEEGWAVLDKKSHGDGSSRAWCESGDLDTEGHKSGWKIVRYIPQIIYEITERIESLFCAGWGKIYIVTDHGWILMPDGLPKVDLPSAVTENKCGRCAVLKAGARTKERQFPWYWNENQPVAFASGISCYREGMEYTHGGLSLQAS